MSNIVTCAKEGHFYDSDLFDVCPYCNPDGVEKEIQSDPSNADTVPFSPDDKKTQIFFNPKIYKIGPVAGWLVCIEGPDKGMDYRILAGRNQIGRSDAGGNKYEINLTDTSISRSKAVASIAYDEKHNNFIFGASDSGNLLPYVDGEPAMNQVVLKSFSKIEIGDTTMMFVPFCGEQFKWLSKTA